MTIARTETPGIFSPQTANGDGATRQVLKSAVSLYSFAPAAVVHPTTENEIVQVVQAAAQQDLKVRAIGSLHSLAPIPATEGVCIVLDQYKSLVTIEGCLVTVQAGMKLWELNEVLAQHHLALPVLGTIVQQTVAGAISTGTHGGDRSLSGYLQCRCDFDGIARHCFDGDVSMCPGIFLAVPGLCPTDGNVSPGV
jgi:FAD/FMN-containing dehydrogenase